MTEANGGILRRLWRTLRGRQVKRKAGRGEWDIRSAVRISPHSRASVRDDILVVLDIASGRLFRAGGAGSEIWRGLAASMPLETVAAEISARTGAPLDDASLAVTQFVARLRDLGLAVAAGR